MCLPLNRLGLSDAALAAADRMLRRTEGIVLVTGPTGSGKTSTVYSMLETLGGGERNIVSIEDPVEFSVPYVRQMEVDERHGVTMTSGLRTLLRMDPDVVFVGEIRDAEAGDIGMRAASSGKYVFSTLHTRDVASTVTALRDLHIDNRSLAGNLAGIISQRIVRRLCRQCRHLAPPSDLDRAFLAEHGVEPPESLYQAAACNHCRGTGWFGRIGVFEVVVADEEFAALIARGATEQELRQHIRGSGVPDLTADALSKVHEGITSVDEVRRIHWV
jgi:type II secretory ATPase GspE/PulE/Tfp pilus assembly ATPase PilB-like protein